MNSATQQKKILSIMTSDQTHPYFSSASLLFLLSLLYSAGIRLWRNFYTTGWRPAFKLSRPVVSVGNLTVGGTGKTPMTLCLAGLMRQMGYRVAIISRGYKGDYRRAPFVVSDGRSILCDARQAGDEPYLMASLLKDVPVVVGRDRYAAGCLAIKQFSPDSILLDDAFQHLRLHRDLNLLLLDARRPFGNNHLLPRGTLREPSNALMRSDAIVLTRSNPRIANDFEKTMKAKVAKPVFTAFHRSIIRLELPSMSYCRNLGEQHLAVNDGRAFRNKKLFAFSGLADNHSFRDSIIDLGGELCGAIGFKDHHRYNETDKSEIIRAAQRAGAKCLVTTDKDYVRFKNTWKWPLPLIVLGVTMEVDDSNNQWRKFIERHLINLAK